MFGWRKYEPEMFTATRSGGRPISRQALACSQAERIAQSVMGRIRPVSSASGMNLAGETRSSSG
ncbi:hypothetical protein D3C86_2010090 [compost metagenome]